MGRPLAVDALTLDLPDLGLSESEAPMTEANWLAARGEGLKRGQLVASGSCTGMTEFSASDVLLATFGAVTAVAAEFSPENIIIEVKQ